jgi:iron complex transport system substrate-binding protein
LSHYFSLSAVSKKIFCFLIISLPAVNAFSQRVVSLAPGITEIVFALGKGKTLVGVTKFCDFPAAAKNIKNIGGYLDVNMETLIDLAPDIVIIYPEHSEKMKFLRRQAKIVMVQHRRLSDLLQSIREIGRVLHSENEAKRLVISIKSDMQDIARRVKGRKKVRTLFIAGRNVAELKNMYIIGKKDFINDLLDIAGGVNAYEGNLDYPSVSLESVIYLNPELIIEISSHYEGIADEKIFALWRPYDMVKAVAKNQIRIIKNSFWLRPGPRIGLIAEELAGLLVPAGN